MISRILLLLMFLLALGCKDESISLTRELTLSEEDRQSINLIPLPYSTILGSDTYTFSNNIKWSFEGPTDDVIKQSFNTTTDWIETLDLTNSSPAWTITIKTKNAAPKHPYVGVDEAYDLSITEGTINITATNGIGAAHGLQTLRQLISTDDARPTIPAGTIHDQPRYPWRGLMIDVSRHFMPIEVLYQNIDAMSIMKMNTLHLHLTDNQGFRIECKTHPKLHKLGSDGQYYTQSQMQELIQYAAERGIRIVPEFDLPGHASSWLTAYPEYGSRRGNYQLQSTYGAYPDAIDPTNQEVYLFLATFIKEMSELFPDEYIHIGSNEVLPQDWAANETIADFIKDKKLNGYQDLQTYFNLRMLDLVKRAGKKMIAWDEALHPETAKNQLTTQAWRSHDVVYESALMGSPVILSHGWHLDHNLPISELYQVDPDQEPAYMNFNPDRNTWAAYEISSEHPIIPQKGVLFTFGSKQNMSGYLNIMGRQHVIHKIEWKEERMSFQFKNSSGPMRAELNRNEKGAITGSINLSFMGIPIGATQIGGDTMDSGIVLPAFNKPQTPTAAQLKNILGGEATMWTEWADETNVNARIWPRTVAIAEKLWSPKELTTDIDDIYRRTNSAVTHLSDIGVLDDRHQFKVMSQWTTNVEMLRSLYGLIQLLEEVKYHDRWSAHPDHTTATAMDRVADIVPTESLQGQDFGLLVDQYVKDPQENQRVEIIKNLAQWSSNYDRLKELIQDHAELGQIEYHSLVLSDLSKIGLTLSTGTPLTNKELTYIQRVKSGRDIARGGTTLSVLPALLKFIDSHINPS